MVLFKSPATLAVETDAAYFADQTVQRTFYVQPIVDLTANRSKFVELMFDAPIDAPIDASISAGIIKPSAVSSIPQGDTINLLNTITPPVTANSSFSFRDILSTVASIISSGTTVVAAGESRDQLMKSIV